MIVNLIFTKDINMGTKFNKAVVYIPEDRHGLFGLSMVECRYSKKEPKFIMYAHGKCIFSIAGKRATELFLLTIGELEIKKIETMISEDKVKVIAAECCNCFVGEMDTITRKMEVVFARWLVYDYFYSKCGYRLLDCQNIFNIHQHHSTVLNSINKLNSEWHIGWRFDSKVNFDKEIETETEKNKQEIANS